MKQIPLTNSGFALVDDEDFEWINQWKWYARADYKSGKKYAFRTNDLIAMHRFIMGAKRGQMVDHKNNNETLNNQRSNLRFCTASQNNWNQGVNKANTTGFKGVRWHKRNKRFEASIKVNKKQKYLGCFSDPVSAAKAYDEAAKKYHGEFARLNFK